MYQRPSLVQKYLELCLCGVDATDAYVDDHGVQLTETTEFIQ